MKVWIVIYRAGAADRDEGGVDDDVFVVAYKNINKAQLECRGHLKEIYQESRDGDGDELSTDEIEWAEVTDNKNRGLRKFYGRPKADVEGWFDLLQVEVV